MGGGEGNGDGWGGAMHILVPGLRRLIYRRSGRRTLPVPQTQAGRWLRLKGNLDSAAARSAPRCPLRTLRPAPHRSAPRPPPSEPRFRDVSTARAGRRGQGPGKPPRGSSRLRVSSPSSPPRGDGEP